MKDNQSTKTAPEATVIRAVHPLIDDIPHILENPLSALLLSEDAVESIRQNPSEYESPWARAFRFHIVLRSRFAEDALCHAV